MLIWSIHNMFMMHTPIYRLSNARETTRQARSSRHCTIKSVTSYIITICSNVLVTVSALQRSIELNTNFRILGKNEFKKNLFKLMNNAVFGKIIENVCNHVNVRLVMRWDGRYGVEAMISKPNFHSRAFFPRISR